MGSGAKVQSQATVLWRLTPASTLLWGLTPVDGGMVGFIVNGL